MLDSPLARDWPLYSVYHSMQLIVMGRGDMAVIRNTQVAAIQRYDYTVAYAT